MGAQIRRIGRILRVLKDSAVLFPYPQLIDKPAGSKVLVLAPHPDDDILGCGGTLVKHVRAGASVTVLYLTDGRKGDPTFASEDDLVRQRQREARAACSVLGVERLEFFGIPDQELRASENLVARIGESIGRHKPDLIYVPFFLDNHADHYETCRALARVREARGIDIAAYETWTPLAFPNIVIDISRTVSLKERALRCHETQLKVIDYVAAFRGLGAYRGAFARTRFAEAFMFMKIEEYAGLASEFEKRRRMRRASAPQRK